jgi:hypothetical protein
VLHTAVLLVPRTNIATFEHTILEYRKAKQPKNKYSTTVVEHHLKGRDKEYN